TADASGMMISYIQSNYQGLGSGVVVDGISMQNRGYSFVLRPDHPNVVAPRKRPFQTIIPAFITKNGQPMMSFGVMGGSMQAQGTTKSWAGCVAYLKTRRPPRDARRGRIDRPLPVKRGAGGPADVVEELQGRGHQIGIADRTATEFGRAQLIYCMEDGYLG